jgi:hypothetical protein
VIVLKVRAHRALLPSPRASPELFAGSYSEKSLLVRFSAFEEDVVMLAGASMGGAASAVTMCCATRCRSPLPLESVMWFNWKKKVVYQVLSLEHVRANETAPLPAPSSCVRWRSLWTPPPPAPSSPSAPVTA